MYPSTLFGLFPPFPQDDVVFVAMSFSDVFRSRWENVIEPVIGRIEVNGVRQRAQRVDMRVVSDSILTEILQGISRCRIFFADITTIGYLENRPVRNANVLYEVGLAQAIRLPEEVLLFRSDKDDLIFDVANIRVHTYDPDGNPNAARDIVANTIISSSRELDLRKNLAIRRAAEALNHPSWFVLAQAQGTDGIRHPATRTMGQALGAISQVEAISRLLDLGAIRAEFTRITPEMITTKAEAPAEDLLRYRATPFGNSLFAYVVEQLGIVQPEIRSLLEKEFGNK